METIKAIREIQLAISQYEAKFEIMNRVSFIEAMILLTLKEGKMNASEIARRNSLSPSNTSKVLSKVEKKWLVERIVKRDDKRQMLFSITKEGESVLSRMRYTDIELPEILEDSIKRILG